MTCIRIDDLPILEELGQEELQGIYGEGLFPGERLRLLAAAATLGLTLASAPFALAGNQGRGQGGGQGGRSGNSHGPSRTSAPLHGQRTSGHSHGGIHTAHAPRHTQSSHSRQSHGPGSWQGADCHREGHGGGNHYFENVGSYCQEHGVKFSHGFYYAGKAQKHFTEKWYDWRYETYLYFDPHAHCPYYWCEAHGVFYPIQYIETVPPGAKGPGPLVGSGPGAGVKGGGVPGGGVPGGGVPGGGVPGGGVPGGGVPGGGVPGGGVPGGGVPGGGVPGDGAPGGGAPPVGAGQIPGGGAGGAGGAPDGGAPDGGAPGGGAQGGGAPGGGAPGGGAQGGGAPLGDGSAAGPEDGAAAGGAPGVSKGGAGAAPAKPAAAPSGVSVAKRGTAKKQLQSVPPGTFDEAIPEEPN